MLSGSKDALKKALVGVGQDFQATDRSEITYEECLEKARSAVRNPRPARAAAHGTRLCSDRLQFRAVLTLSVCFSSAVHQRLSFLCERQCVGGCWSHLYWTTPLMTALFYWPSHLTTVALARTQPASRVCSLSVPLSQESLLRSRSRKDSNHLPLHLPSAPAHQKKHSFGPSSDCASLCHRHFPALNQK